MTSVDPKTLSQTDCTSSVSKANGLNAADLFQASAVCHAVRRDAESNFLLAAGQVRGTADMSLMAPATKADLEAAAALYGFIFYYAGGPGEEEVLRDPSARAKFFQLLDAWNPTYSAAYSPGWNVGRRPDEATYRQALIEAKADRRRQFVDLARLLSDDHYYSLHQQFANLHKRNAGTFVQGTPDEKLLSDLRQRMADRARALGIDTGVPADDLDENVEKPPSAPGPDETVVTSSADPTAKQCSEWAEHLALMSVSKIVRVVMTTGSKWGLVWRADIASSDQPPEISRFICSKHGTLLQSGDAMHRPPLP